jgi:hypothetical protein
MMRRGTWTVLLAPLLLSGCGVVGLSASGDGGSDAAAAGAPPSAPGWVVVSRGSATPSARPGYPAASPTPLASGFLPLGTPTPTRTPVSTCSPNLFDFSKIGPADVVPGRTSAVVSWYNVGGYNLVQFRLTATSQDPVGGKQRDVGWLVVEPGRPCGWMSATVTGLDRRTGYMFTVDAVVHRRSGDGTHAATVARSLVVSTT